MPYTSPQIEDQKRATFLSKTANKIIHIKRACTLNIVGSSPSRRINRHHLPPYFRTIGREGKCASGNVQKRRENEFFPTFLFS